jgi:hypothetical protein
VITVQVRQRRLSREKIVTFRALRGLEAQISVTKKHRALTYSQIGLIRHARLPSRIAAIVITAFPWLK